MKKNESSDAFAHYVIGRIRPDIRNSLNKEQFDEIRAAIAAASPNKYHTVDIRGMIPLFFARYYFVFLLGRDKRSKTKHLEFNRRNETNTIYSQLFLFILVVPFIIAAFTMFYLFKVESGVDFFPAFHLKDLFIWEE